MRKKKKQRRVRMKEVLLPEWMKFKSHAELSSLLEMYERCNAKSATVRIKLKDKRWVAYLTIRRTEK